MSKVKVQTANNRKNIKVAVKSPTDINKVKVKSSKVKTVVAELYDGGEF